MRGHMKEFHWLTAVMRIRAVRVGLEAGRTIRVRMRIWPAPSILAASMSSRGTDRKLSRRRRTAPGEASMKGTTTPQNVFLSPAPAVMR